MRALVTGATGFLGKRLLSALRARGDEVVTLARHSAPDLPSDVRQLVGDVREGVPAELREHCDRIYHLAAIVSFDSRRRRELCAVNADGTRQVLRAARASGARTVVVSSACTLGTSELPAPLRDERAHASEAEALANPYLESKLQAEQVARDASADQAVVIVNPTTVYGPGDASLNSGTLVCQVARSKILPVPPGGSSIVDVDDVAAGIIAAGELGRSGERYLLTSANLSFRELFDRIAAVLGRRPLLVPIPRASAPVFAAAAAVAGRVLGGRFLTPQIVGDLFRFRHYDASKARRELGWLPRHDPESSVRRAWEYYRQRGLA